MCTINGHEKEIFRKIRENVPNSNNNKREDDPNSFDEKSNSNGSNDLNK
jgi:hypothetical protein